MWCDLTWQNAGLRCCAFYFVAVKEIAMGMGLHATFMAKPFSWGASNGGHTNHSLWTTDASGVRTNAFYDAESVRNLALTRRLLVR